MTDDLHALDLDERLRSRLVAAAARPDVRRVRRHGDGYVADSRTGDRVIQLRIGVRPDGSVWEENDNFLITDVRRSEVAGEGTVRVELAAPPRVLEVAAEVVGRGPAVEGPDGVEGALAELMAATDYPMYLVTTAADGEQAGCLVGFVTQASIDPPRLLVCLSVQNRTYQVANRASTLVVHTLSDSNATLAALFGEQTGDDVDKFAHCRWEPGPDHVPVLSGTNGWAALRVVSRHGLGDHVGFLGEVVAARCEAGGPPLRFHAVRDFEAGHRP